MQRRTEAELVEMLHQARKRVPTGRWRHERTGVVYWVTGISLWSGGLEPVVTYHSADADSHVSFSRDIHDFVSKFERVKS